MDWSINRQEDGKNIIRPKCYSFRIKIYSHLKIDYLSTFLERLDCFFIKYREVLESVQKAFSSKHALAWTLLAVKFVCDTFGKYSMIKFSGSRGFIVWDFEAYTWPKCWDTWFTSACSGGMQLVLPRESLCWHWKTLTWKWLDWLVTCMFLLSTSSIVPFFDFLRENYRFQFFSLLFLW